MLGKTLIYFVVLGLLVFIIAGVLRARIANKRLNATKVSLIVATASWLTVVFGSYFGADSISGSIDYGLDSMFFNLIMTTIVLSWEVPFIVLGWILGMVGQKRNSIKMIVTANLLIEISLLTFSIILSLYALNNLTNSLFQLLTHLINLAGITIWIIYRKKLSRSEEIGGEVKTPYTNTRVFLLKIVLTILFGFLVAMTYGFLVGASGIIVGKQNATEPNIVGMAIYSIVALLLTVAMLFISFLAGKKLGIPILFPFWLLIFLVGVPRGIGFADDVVGAASEGGGLFAIIMLPLTLFFSASLFFIGTKFRK